MLVHVWWFLFWKQLVVHKLRIWETSCQSANCQYIFIVQPVSVASWTWISDTWFTQLVPFCSVLVFIRCKCIDASYCYSIDVACYVIRVFGEHKVLLLIYFYLLIIIQHLYSAILNTVVKCRHVSLTAADTLLVKAAAVAVGRSRCKLFRFPTDTTQEQLWIDFLSMSVRNRNNLQLLQPTVCRQPSAKHDGIFKSNI